MKNIEEVRKKLNGTKVHAVAVQKGGTGKTTIKNDICYALAKMGFKVLAIDSDPQASLSTLCNIDVLGNTLGLDDLYSRYVNSVKNRKPLTIDEIKEIWYEDDGNGNNLKKPKYSAPVRGSIEMETREFGFDLIPAKIELAGWDILLSTNNALGRTSGISLNRIVEVIKTSMDYDFIIIDTCPGLGNLVYNAIAAGIDGTIIPVNLEPLTIKGAQNLINTITEIQRLLEPARIIHKGVLGIVKNQYAPRLKIQQRFEGVVETFFPIPTFKTTIPTKTSCDVAHDRGRLYGEFDPKIGKKFEELAEEIVKEDIRRADEKEVIMIKEFGIEEWKKVNELGGEE